MSISRTPLYPRYDVTYAAYQVTEPSGFGPYRINVATGLGSGQDANTQRWPEAGDSVTYTASVRNRGSDVWNGPIPAIWWVDGEIASQPVHSLSLPPGGIDTFSFVLPWDDQIHDLRFAIALEDDRPVNDTLIIQTKSVPFVCWVDRTFLERFRQDSSQYPQAVTDDFLDWLNYHVGRFNEMLAEAGSARRIHFDDVRVLEDSDSDPPIDMLNFAQWPNVGPPRFHANDELPRRPGWYSPDDDVEYGWLHEFGHQLGLIDLYRLDIDYMHNPSTDRPYLTVPCLMNQVSHFFSPTTAGAMDHWLDKAPGYFGQYLFCMPRQLRLRLVGRDHQALAGARVTMYQQCVREYGQDPVITDQIKATGTTDQNGVFPLPNVEIDPNMIPPAFSGDTLYPNPFGYVDILGVNAVLHFKVEYDGRIDFTWLDIPEANLACFNGDREVGTFEKEVFSCAPSPQFPESILYQANLDTLLLGPLQNPPGDPGQDSWYMEYAPSGGRGAIQDSVAMGARALDVYQPGTPGQDLRTTIARAVSPLDLNASPLITLAFDFYCRTSNLDAQNAYSGSFHVGGGPWPFPAVASISMDSGWWGPKGERGLCMGMWSFSREENVERGIPLSMGQGLTWNQWHSVVLTIDHTADSYRCVTVDGVSQDLFGWPLPRGFDGSVWLPGEQVDVIGAGVLQYGADLTNDHLYIDNVTVGIDDSVGLSAPEPRGFDFCSLAPNPSRGPVVLRFGVPTAGPVTLDVFDVAGRLVRRLHTGSMSAGEHSICWDGLDGRGRAVSSGAYLTRLSYAKGDAVRRVLLIR
jgi:hypothetical protein